MSKEIEALFYDVIGLQEGKYVRLHRFMDDIESFNLALNYAIDNIDKKPYIVRTCVDLISDQDIYQEPWITYEQLKARID